MEDYKTPYRGAVVASGAILILYGLTLAPSTAFWDASEYIATGHILGIPHPPGNPLFVVLARVWGLLLAPLGLSVAVKTNLLAATTSAGAGFFFFLVVHRLLHAFGQGGWVARVGAGSAVLLGGTAFTVWHQSTVNEKVYTVSVLVIAAVSWLVLRWRDEREAPGRGERYLLVAGYVMILGAANHQMSLLPLPAVGVFVLLVGPAVLWSRTFLMRAIPLVLLGLSFNVFLPIRAEQRPAINEGDPLCETASDVAISVLSNGRARAGCYALSSVLTRDQYAKPPLSERQSPFRSQFANYFQYFDWQWARGLDPSPRPAKGRVPFTLLFLGLGLFGLMVVYRADKEAFVYLATLTGTLTVGLVFYLNFKYGYSLAPEVTNMNLHEVRERDYFFIASFIVWGALVGLGLAGVWSILADRLSSAKPFLAASPVMVIALIPLIFNWAWASRAGDYAARDWAYDLLMTVEPYGILFTNGDNDTFPLWYLQEVEDIRKDVTVVVVQYLATTWYPKQLQELTVPDRQRPFLDEFDGGGLHQAPLAPPTRPLVTLALSDMDQIGGGIMPQDFNVNLGPVVVQYPSGTRLNRGHLLALAIIRDSIAERSIYFASSAGLINQLGLRQWGVKEGIATRLALSNPAEQEGLVQVAANLGGEWLNLERSMTLVRNVYSYRGLRDRDIWADRATLNIPWQYYILLLQLTDAATKAGRDQDLVQSLAEDAQAFLETARGGRLGGVSE